MLIDRSHARWFIATVALFAASTAAYVYYARTALNGPTGNTWPGLFYGFVGTALMVYAALIGVRRKRAATLRIGRAETWLKGHIWLGLLSYPLIWYHAGFQMGGPLTTVLMVIFTVVVLSGIHGLAMQYVIPRRLTADVRFETVYEQIDHVLAQLLDEAERAVIQVCGLLEPPPAPEPAAVGAGAKGAEGKADGAKPEAKHPPRRQKVIQPKEGSEGFKKFYVQEVKPFLAGTGGHKGPLASPTDRGALFEQVRVSLPVDLHKVVTHLEEICEERRQLLLQKRLQHWLHGWLLVHVPLSTALMLLTLVHAIMALKY